MTNFYERQLQRMFGESEVLSADTVFAGKAMVSKISDDLRAKIEFVTARVSGQYEGLKLSIINKNEGLIDSQTFMFHEIIGLKGAPKETYELIKMDFINTHQAKKPYKTAM